MSEWVKACAVSEAPGLGEVMERDVNGVAVCVANVDGTLHALDNWCPHRRGPLGQGWVEGRSVVCPWHSWGFDCETGRVVEPAGPARVDVFPLKMDGEDVLVQLP